MMVKTISFMRGLDQYASLVAILERNFKDMLTFSFVVIFRSASKQDAEAAHFSFDEYWYLPFITAFNMGFFGAFDLDTFETLPKNSWVAEVIFVIFMIGVSVVALNALIAILGESFGNVQEHKNSIRNFEVANLINEYSDALGAGTVA